MRKENKSECIKSLPVIQTQWFIGQYFHTFSDDGSVKYQGRILNDAGYGYFLCELYSWMDGQSGNSQIFHIDKMKDWHFYPTAEQMNYRYEVSLKHIKPRDIVKDLKALV